jgi:hypothetical protein
MAKKKRNRTSPEAVNSLDVLCYELEGEDPRPMVELPEGVNVGTCCDATTDAIGSVYDAEPGIYYAVMVLVGRGSTAADAAAHVVQVANHVAGELFGETAELDQEEAEDGE